jgi:hypothetical protein
MTDHVEHQHHEVLTKQKRWLKARRRVGDPCAAFVADILIQSHKDVAGLVGASKAVLIARHQAVESLNALDRTCATFHQALVHARNVEHYIRGSHHKTTPVPLREVARILRRKPENIAEVMFEGVNPGLVKLLRQVPGAWCPACGKAKEEE